MSRPPPKKNLNTPPPPLWRSAKHVFSCFVSPPPHEPCRSRRRNRYRQAPVYAREYPILTMRRCLPMFVIVAAAAALGSATAAVTSRSSGRIVRTVAANRAELSVEGGGGGGGGGSCGKLAYMPAYVIPKGSPVDPCITCRPRRTTPCYMKTLTVKCTTPAMKDCGLQNRVHKPIFRRRRQGIVVS